jgi:hypothetical protein
MSSYLVVAIVAESDKGLLEGMFTTASSFLGTAHATRRRDLGSYRRPARGKSKASDEFMQLVEFSWEDAAADPAKARSLEGVLRSTLTAAGAEAGEVRVFVGGA